MDLTLNRDVMNVELSGIRQFTYLVRDTPGACALTIGEPDLNTPDVIKEAAKAALDDNDTHYPPGNGYPYALEAISRFEAEAHGLRYAPSEIILTVGATEALFAAFSTILNAGDEVIIPTPAFGLYEALVQLQGGVPVSLPTEHNHFQIVPEELKAAITDKTKAIILTSPNNPTGCVYTKETLDAVHDILKDKPIFVLCDDVYRTLTYCEDYHSFAEYQDMRDRIIVINSFSKPYAMTGWRLGWCMADARLMDRIQVFHQYAVTSVPAFVQRACVKALETDTGEVVKLSVPTKAGMTVKLAGSAELVLVDRSRNFDDTRNHWAKDAINFATAHELFSGTSDTAFTPDNPMTRAMLMTVLARFDGQDTTGGAVWYEKAMEWARENGISDGSDPDGSITREQLATMLWRYAGSPAGGSSLSSFGDSASVSAYALEAVRWAVGEGLISGTDAGLLAPQGSATRAQVATILMRFVESLTK